MGGPSRPSPATSSSAVAALPTYDRAFWLRHSQRPSHLKLSAIFRGLGLKQLNPGPGRARFDGEAVAQLARAVDEVSEKLPKSQEQLLQATSYDYVPLQQDIAHLLYRFGDEIWSSEKDRPWLLQAAKGRTEYPKDLVFDNAADRDVLTYYLRLWIISRAMNSFRSRVLKGTQKDYQTVQDDTVTHAADAGIQLQQPLQHNEADVSVHLASEQQVLRDTPQTQTQAETAATDTVTISAHRPQSPNLALKSNGTNLRRTARNRKPRKQFDDVNHSVVHSGVQDTKRVARSATENKTHTDTSQRTLPDVQPGRSKKRKIIPNEEVARDEQPSNHDALAASNLSTELGRKHPEHLGKGVLTKPPLEPPKTQEHSADVEQEVPTLQRKRHSSRRLLSKDFIRNSSDESEIDNDILIHGTAGTQPTTITFANSPQEASPKSGLTTANSTSMPSKTRSYPLNEYWNEDTWRHYAHNGRLLVPIMRSLGLKVSDRGDIAQNGHTAALMDDVDACAKMLCDQFPVQDLIICAANPNYLDTTIFDLFDIYDAKMWSQDADRSVTLKAGEETSYPKELFYEDDDDRQLLGMNLHRWIFARAFKIYETTRNWHKENTRNKAKKMGTSAAGAERPMPAASTIPAESLTHQNSSTPSTAKASVRRSQNRSENGAASSVRSANDRPSKRHKKQTPLTEMANAADLSAQFYVYLDMYHEPKYDELPALDSLEKEAALLLPRVLHLLGPRKGRSVIACLTTAFPAWTKWRREIVTVENEYFSSQLTSALSKELPHHHAVVIDRSRSATKLRQANDDFRETGNHACNAEDVICETFTLLREVHGGEDMQEKIRTKFKEMELQLYKLGNELMDGGGSWIFRPGLAPLGVQARAP
ncbi:hypothetical protein N0V94_002549 [Neodidymelliopsis sp. IMI 364377]|nr:hypothetical protein N0V94_002549 [Neodidymelliopsis sp. IMI 364377]